MKASKEECQRIIETVELIAKRCERLYEDPARINAENAKGLEASFHCLKTFLVEVEKGLPTEEMLEHVAKRVKESVANRYIREVQGVKYAFVRKRGTDAIWKEYKLSDKAKRNYGWIIYRGTTIVHMFLPENSINILVDLAVASFECVLNANQESSK